MLITLTWLRLDGLRRWRSLAVLALLIALATATVLTSIAGARRGQTAFDRLWARTLPATATVLPNQPGFDWAKVAALPEVAALTKFPVVFGYEAQGYTGASTGFPLADDQMTRTIERLVMIAGRPFNPRRADEVIVTPKFAATSGKHVGDTLILELASVQQANQEYDGSTGPPLGPKIRARIVGVGRTPWGLDADTPGSPGGILSTPALFSRYRANMMGTNGQAYINALVRLKGGQAAIPAFRADLARVTGRSDIDVWDNLQQIGDPMHKVSAYEAACLLAFGLAALAAALFLIGQSVARYTSATVADLQVLQALGMTRRQVIAAASAGPALAGVAGSTLGVAGAIVASRWMPIGLASIAEPHPGIDADWLVLIPGWILVPLLVLAGSAAAAAMALTAGRRQATQRRSAIAAALAAVNFPVPLVVGARFALEPGRGRSSVPVRSALVGAVVGVLGVLAAFTFSAGVSDAATHPQRFGQTWQLTTFLGYNGQDFGPASQVLRAVAADRDVTGVDTPASAARRPVRSPSRASPTPRWVASVRRWCSRPGGCPPARTRSCWPRPPPRNCTPGRARWSGSPAVAPTRTRCGSPASASFPRGRTTGTRTEPGSLPAGTTGSSMARITRSSSTPRPCRCGRARTCGRSPAAWTPPRPRSPEVRPSRSRRPIRCLMSRRSRTWNCCRSR